MQIFKNITLINIQSFYFIDSVSLERCKIRKTFCARYSFVRIRRGSMHLASFLFNTTGDRFRYPERDHPRESVMSRSTVPRNHFGNLQVFKALTRLGDPWSKKSQKASWECLFARTGTHLKRTFKMQCALDWGGKNGGNQFFTPHRIFWA